MTEERLHTLVGSGEGSQIEYSIYVENGRVIYETENSSHAFMRNGACTETQEITLDDLKNGRVRGGRFYEAAKAEVERQLKIMKVKKPTPEA
jgi:hypothetical protein